MENPPFWWYLRGKMGIFIGYVSFREGIIMFFFRWLEPSSLSPTTFCKKKTMPPNSRFGSPGRANEEKTPFWGYFGTQVKREIGLKSTFRYRQKKTLRIRDLFLNHFLFNYENYTNPTSSAIARRYRLSPRFELFWLVVLHQVLYVRVACKWWGCSIAML